MSQENTTKVTPTVFEFNGAKYEFDVRDADSAALFEDAIEQMRVEEKNQPKVGKISDIIRYQCNFLKTFFDRCLGEGAGVAICGEKDKVNVCYEAYEAFLNHVASQRDYLKLSNGANPFSKYSNREQRRAAAKKPPKKK